MKNLIVSTLVAVCSVTACVAQAPTYHEPFRPQVHFSQGQHWMNDPNGLVYFEGEYHLFFQYNPTAMTPGHIGWGHAVSRDLLHWQELPEALPELNGEMIFTGSAVVDEKNTSGLCQGGKPCLVAIYTGHRGEGADRLEAQNIASSQDRGRTWTRYPGNPVLNLHMPEFRDPGVSWNEITKSWVMAVALPNDHKVSLYTSPDLKQWTHLTDFGPAGTTAGQWECPNLLKVPSADGKPAMWAMKVGINPGGLQGGSGEQYFLGSFDGKTFTQSTDPGSHGWTDYGKDSYCAISYNHLPAGSKPTLIGWMNNWQYADKVPTSPWRGQMTMPRAIHYLRDADGLALVEEPVTRPLREGAGKPLGITLPAGRAEGASVVSGSPTEITAAFSLGDATDAGLRLYSDGTHWTEIGFSKTSGQLYVDRRKSGQDVGPNFPARTDVPLAAHRPLNLRVIVDHDSVEVFAQNGTLAMTNLIFPPTQTLRITPFRAGGSGVVKVSGQVWKLQSIWPKESADVH